MHIYITAEQQNDLHKMNMGIFLQLTDEEKIKFLTN